MAMAASVSSRRISLSHAPPVGGRMVRTASCPRRVDAYSARCSSNSRHPHASRLCARSVSGLTSLPRAGLVPAAALALLVQGGFDLLERFLVSEGLRLKPMP